MKKKKKNSAAAKPKAKKANPKPAAFVMRPAVAAAPKKKNNQKKKKNPEILGVRMKTSELGMTLLAGLVGVTVTKMVTPMLPESITSTNFGRFAASAGVALGAGMLAQSVNPQLGLAVGFGGGMQAASVGLNAFLPKIGQTIGLQGVRRRPGVGQIIDVPYVPVFNPLAGGVNTPAALPPAPAVLPAFTADAVPDAYPAPY